MSKPREFWIDENSNGVWQTECAEPMIHVREVIPGTNAPVNQDVEKQIEEWWIALPEFDDHNYSADQIQETAREFIKRTEERMTELLHSAEERYIYLQKQLETKKATEERVWREAVEFLKSFNPGCAGETILENEGKRKGYIK